MASSEHLPQKTAPETPRSMLRYLLCGLAMGAADVVPGVSGGTIAFITGIYQKLLDGIQAFNLHFFRRFLTGHFREALSLVPLKFLIPLASGIAVSIFSLAKLVLYLLHEHPVVIWSFFFGLILASIVLLLREMRASENMGASAWIAMVVGAIFAWWLTGANPVSTSNNLPTLFFCAFIAICAMILPGISGAFVLVLLGQYQNILTAVTTFNFSVLAVFAAGCVCGLLCFARVLNACLARFHAQTLALLIGVMAGSLRTVWPWKDGTFPALPSSFGSETTTAAICCLVGIILPIVISRLGLRTKPQHGE